MIKRFLPFLVIGGIFFLLIVLVVYHFLSPTTPSQLTATPTASTFPQVPTTTGTLGQLQIGVSTATDLAKLAKPLRRDSLPNGDTQYTYISTHATRPDIVILSGNVVSYVQLSTPDDIAQAGYSTLAQYEETFGQPDMVTDGTAAYSYPLETYIYSTKGLVIIANPASDEVYEIQKFQPMSADNYLNSYGKAIKQNPHPQDLPNNL